MRDNDIQILLCQIHDYLRGLCNGHLLLFNVLAEGIASEGNHYLLPSHRAPPIETLFFNVG